MVNESSARTHPIDALARLSAAVALAAVVACGGADQLAGISGGGTGIASAGGTVTGFGSLVVDGTRWDDAAARVETEISPAHPPVAAEVRLGQRTHLLFSADGAAQIVRVEAQVIGRVAQRSAAGAPPQITVAGQTVRINRDPDRGPVTIFGGFAALTDLAIDDVVEVHGVQVSDPAAAAVLQATRIERLPTLPAGWIRVTGRVEGHDPGAGIFRLGGLTVATAGGTTRVPGSRPLANGQRVTAWGPEPLAAGPRLNATFVRIHDPAAPADSTLELSGAVSRYRAADSAFEVDGHPVLARGAVVVPAGQSLAEGLYVIVRGTLTADGSLNATQVRIRRPVHGDREVEVEGTIVEFSTAAAFIVRGVAIDAGAVAARPGCPASLEAGLFVEIDGSIVGDRVRANRLRCKSPPAGSTQTFIGVAAAVDTAARSFTLTPAGDPALTIHWNEATAFIGGAQPGAELNGRRVEVDAVGAAAGRYTARRIKPR